MLIDWFTVGAQVLNFVILVWLMKRFLYGPVQAAIAAREKRIADELAGADRQRAEAASATVALAARSAAFDGEREALMVAARSAAEAERTQLIDAARVAADALGAQRRERLASEADDLAGSLRRRTVEGVFSIARKALGDIASTGLEASACDTFNARLRAQDAPARGVFARALTDAAGVGRVRSAFDLPEAQRGAIRGAVDEVFALRSTLSFETAPDLVCGIEIAASGQKISWSFDDELTALERGVGGLLRGEPGARATAS